MVSPRIVGGGVAKLMVPTFVFAPLSGPNSFAPVGSDVKSAWPDAAPLLLAGVMTPSMQKGPAFGVHCACAEGATVPTIAIVMTMLA